MLPTCICCGKEKEEVKIMSTRRAMICSIAFAVDRRYECDLCGKEVGTIFIENGKGRLCRNCDCECKECGV